MLDPDYIAKGTENRRPRAKYNLKERCTAILNIFRNPILILNNLNDNSPIIQCTLGRLFSVPFAI